MVLQKLALPPKCAAVLIVQHDCALFDVNSNCDPRRTWSSNRQVTVMIEAYFNSAGLIMVRCLDKKLIEIKSKALVGQAPVYIKRDIYIYIYIYEKK